MAKNNKCSICSKQINGAITIFKGFKICDECSLPFDINHIDKYQIIINEILEKLRKDLKINNKTSLLNKIKLTKKQYVMLCIFVDDKINKYKEN
jgi:hypothetical protein